MNINASQLSHWSKLQDYFDTNHKDLKIPELFNADDARPRKLSVQVKGVFFDYSKNLIDDEVYKLLFGLFKESSAQQRLVDIINGSVANFTEERQVQHFAFRNPDPQNEEIAKSVKETKTKVKLLSDTLRNGQWIGSTGRVIKKIACIGIGGSNLGPEMVVEALDDYKSSDVSISFVKNIDPQNLLKSLNEFNAEETLFIVNTKSFKTDETVSNAKAAKKWLNENIGHDFQIANHFIGLTNNIEAATDFGIDENNIIGIPESVGGRFSVCSGVGLPIAISVGYDNFESFLDGFYSIDKHVLQSDSEKNIPAIMALVSIWYRNFYHSASEAVVPYSSALEIFPKYLQQLFMESNGKSATPDDFVNYSTGYVVWGSAGTPSQHSFFQLFHQGNNLIPIDFIGFKQPHQDIEQHHRKLMSNMFAQSHVLAYGQHASEIRQNIDSASKSDIRHRLMTGNRPNNVLLVDKLTPKSVGQLIAIYEYKAIYQGLIWNINSFDQYGVEMGKKIAMEIEDILSDPNKEASIDPSTDRLISEFSDQNQD